MILVERANTGSSFKSHRPSFYFRETEFSLDAIGHRASHGQETTTRRLPMKSPERPTRFNVSVSIISILALMGSGIMCKEDYAGESRSRHWLVERS